MDTYSNPLVAFIQEEDNVGHIQGYSRLDNTTDSLRVIKENTADSPRVIKENMTDTPRVINRLTGNREMHGQFRLESVDCSERTSTVINSQNSDHETQGKLRLKDAENNENTSRVINRRIGEHGSQEPIRIENHENSRHSHTNGACVRDVRERLSGMNGIGKWDYCKSSEPSLRMRELLEGLVEPGDCGNPAEPPAWLDRQLFHQGQRFYQRFLFCIFFSDLLSLLMIFSISRVLRPLIYTEKSDTPFKALKRYTSTIVHIIRWYSGDVWDSEDDAHKDILSVRSLHKKYANLFSSTKHHPRVDEVTVHKKGHDEPKCPFSSTLRSDLCPQVKRGYKVEDSDTPTLYISQWDMSVTQYAFMGLIVRHPHKLGAWWASESELEGFVHFWRGIGWLLGVDDRYNFCSGTLDETRALCLEMEQRVISPGIAASDWNFEHMCNSLIEGMSTIIPGLSTPSMTCFLADLLGLSIPQFKQRMYKGQVAQYWLMRFIFHILFFVPGVVAIFNELLLALVDATQGRLISGWARWLPRSWLPTTVTPHHYT